MIQDKIDVLSDAEFQVLFKHIRNHLNEISKYQSGNQCIQKIMEVKGDEFKDQIVAVFEADIMNLCVNSQGSKVVQKSFEILELKYKSRLSDAVMNRNANDLRRLIDDQFGNHVIQKVIEKGYIEDISQKKDDIKHKDIFKQQMLSINNLIVFIKSKIVNLCTNSLGCRIIQKLIECIPTEQIKDIVYPEILQNISILAEDKYGNQVIQHILSQSDSDYKTKTINTVSKDIQNLSCQKFSSNVVQECFKMSGVSARSQLLDSILALESKKVIDLMKHMYGNYVVQTALDYATWRQKKAFVQIGMAHKELLKMVRYGKFILKRLEEFNREIRGSRHN